MSAGRVTGSAGSPIVASMAAPPAVVPPVADPSVYIVTLAFVSWVDVCLLLLPVGVLRLLCPGP